MANKKTTLKTQTGDNVYPNVLKENLPAAVVFYGETGQAGEGNESGGSTGGAVSGAADFETVVISDDSKTYTGTLTGTKPIIIQQNFFGRKILSISRMVRLGDDESVICIVNQLAGTTTFSFKKDGQLTRVTGGYYQHCITLTSSTLGKISCNLYTSDDKRYTLHDINYDRDIDAIACSGVVKDNNTYKIATDIYKRDTGNVCINWIDPSNGSTGRTRIDDTFTVEDTVRSLN